MIRIAIADDHAIVRDGLKRILADQADMEVIGEASDGFEAVELVRKLKPDVIILDISMPAKDGLDATREIGALKAATRVLILTMHSDEHYAIRTMRAGATGYLVKGASSEELLRAIRTVAGGQRYLPADLESAFAEHFLTPETSYTPAESLSDREFQVLCLLASGFTNREIAEKLFISVKTVDSHRSRILDKLSLRNNSDLTRFAIEHKLI
jgi:two-component system invasion response regulator UvrY